MAKGDKVLKALDDALDSDDPERWYEALGSVRSIIDKLYTQAELQDALLELRTGPLNIVRICPTCKEHQHGV